MWVMWSDGYKFARSAQRAHKRTHSCTAMTRPAIWLAAALLVCAVLLKAAPPAAAQTVAWSPAGYTRYNVSGSSITSVQSCECCSEWASARLRSST